MKKAAGRRLGGSLEDRHGEPVEIAQIPRGKDGQCPQQQPTVVCHSMAERTLVTVPT